MPRQFVRQEFQRHLTPQRRILRRVHHAHATTAQLLQNVVMRNRHSGQFARIQVGLGRNRSFVGLWLCWLGTRGRTRSYHLLHRRFQPISPPRQRLHEARSLGRIVQRLAQSSDCGVDAVVKFYDRVIRPQLLPDRLTAHHLTRSGQEHDQNLEGLFGQPDLQAIPAQFP